MAKLDEITELITEEFDGFNKSATELKLIMEKLKGIEFKADTSDIEQLLKEHLKRQEKTINFQKREIQEINKKIKRARMTPNWLMVFFCVMISLIVLTLGYYAYEIVLFEDKKEEAIELGKQKMISEFREYFDEHPEVYSDLRDWAKEQDSIAKRKDAP